MSRENLENGARQFRIDREDRTAVERMISSGLPGMSII